MRYRVKLTTYRDQTFNSFVFHAGEVFETYTFELAEKERDKWSERNPEGIYVVEVFNDGDVPEL